MDSTVGTAPEHQAARHRRPRSRSVPDPDIAPRGEEPDPTVVIEIGVDVRLRPDGTWSVVLTPAIPALRTKHRSGLGSLAAVAAEVARMLEALDYGGFSVATTWTLDGEPAAWAARDRLLSPATVRHPGTGSAVEAEVGR